MPRRLPNGEMVAVHVPISDAQKPISDAQKWMLTQQEPQRPLEFEPDTDADADLDENGVARRWIPLSKIRAGVSRCYYEGAAKSGQS